jgi:hypothetical protein
VKDSFKSRSPQIVMGGKTRRSTLETMLKNAGLDTKWLALIAKGVAAYEEKTRAPINVTPDELRAIVRSTRQAHFSPGVAADGEAAAGSAAAAAADAGTVGGVEEGDAGSDALVTMALFGRVGLGKSFVVNSIAGANVTRSADQAESQTPCPVRVTDDKDLPEGEMNVQVVFRSGEDPRPAPSVADAEKIVCALPDASDVLCIDVFINSPTLRELGMRIVDLPGYPECNASKEIPVTDMIKAFIGAGEHRVDVVACIGPRADMEQGHLDRLGLFADIQTSPKVVFLLNPRNPVWEVTTVAPHTYGVLTDDELLKYTNDIRLMLIEKLWNYAFPPEAEDGVASTPARLSLADVLTVGKRMDFLAFGTLLRHPPFFLEQSPERERRARAFLRGTMVWMEQVLPLAFTERSRSPLHLHVLATLGTCPHPRRSEMKGNVGVLGEQLSVVTFDALHDVVRAVRLDRELQRTGESLRQWRHVATTRKLALNSDLSSARNAINKLVVAFKKQHDPSETAFEFDADESFETVFNDMQDELARVAEVVADEAEADQQITELGRALDAIAHAALTEFNTTCKNETKTLVIQWTDHVEEAGKGLDKVKKQIVDDANDRCEAFDENGDDTSTPLPGDPPNMQLFSRHMSNDQLKTVLKRIGSGGDDPATLARVCPRAVFTAVRTALDEQADEVRKAWRAYKVEGALCDMIAGSRGRAPKAEAKAVGGLAKEQQAARAMSTVLEVLVESLSPSVYASPRTRTTSATRGAQRMLNSGYRMPAIQRSYAQWNDAVLDRPAKHLEPADFGVRKTPRPPGAHERILAQVDVSLAAGGAATGEMTFTAVEDADLVKMSVPTSSVQRDTPAVVFPIFVVSKLRATKANVVKQLPSWYTDELESDKDAAWRVVMVVDRSEEQYYLEQSPANVKLVSIQTPPGLPLNIGRKRQVLKLFTEQVLGLTCYWVLDDDFSHFVEVEGLGLMHPPTSMARALVFAQEVLAHELKPGGRDCVDEFTTLLSKAMKAGWRSHDEAREAAGDVLNSILPHELARHEAWHSQSLDEKIVLSMGSDAELLELRGRTQRRTAQIALSQFGSIASHAACRLAMGYTSHINRLQAKYVVSFGVVSLFNGRKPRRLSFG